MSSPPSLLHSLIPCDPQDQASSPTVAARFPSDAQIPSPQSPPSLPQGHSYSIDLGPPSHPATQPGPRTRPAATESVPVSPHNTSSTWNLGLRYWLLLSPPPQQPRFRLHSPAAFHRLFLVFRSLAPRSSPLGSCPFHPLTYSPRPGGLLTLARLSWTGFPPPTLNAASHPEPISLPRWPNMRPRSPLVPTLCLRPTPSAPTPSFSTPLPNCLSQSTFTAQETRFHRHHQQHCPRYSSWQLDWHPTGVGSQAHSRS